MRKKVSKSFAALVVATLLFFASTYYNPSPPLRPCHQTSPHSNSAIREPAGFDTVSILLPEMQVLVIVSPRTPINLESITGDSSFTCLFLENHSSPAKFAGILPSTNQTAFKCDLPPELHARTPLPEPTLTKTANYPLPTTVSLSPIHTSDYLVYDAVATGDDVVLFAKGINNRQGSNRPPEDLRCVFGDDGNITTAVTTSVQEVFRCELPEELTAVASPIKISLRIQNKVVPSVAYLTAPRKIAAEKPKPPICACTMVHNVAKFLKEWVVYHSSIGVEKFILYDNDSDDDLRKVVDDLVVQGYDVSSLNWIWPKTQEAGFSHCAVNYRDSCTWMLYADIDEFIYSPSWLQTPNPSEKMLESLVMEATSDSVNNTETGQIMINCHEFGPSNQTSHPAMGVIQGYNCRRRKENRHKSIVRLEAIDESLLNVIHHFGLKDGYKTVKLGLEKAVVNHYKFQAWSEFKNKFRRRAAAYVADWTKAVNPTSRDRAPGLGFSAVEPEGWPGMFCDVVDERLKDATLNWFGSKLESGDRYMSWQR